MHIITESADHAARRAAYYIGRAKESLAEGDLRDAAMSTETAEWWNNRAKELTR